MLTLSNSLIEASGVSRAASMWREGRLQNQRQELFDQLATVQEEKEKLQEDYNTLQQDHAQCLAELEDERKEKQMYKQKSEEQSSTISALERENSLLKSRISEELDVILTITEAFIGIFLNLLAALGGTFY